MLFVLIVSSNRGIDFRVFQGVLVGHLISFIILSSTLVNFDRSRSVQVLVWTVSNQEIGLLEDDVSKLALKNNESEIAMVQRLNELKSIYLITTSSKKWYPTTLGQAIFRIADFSSTFFNLKNYKVMLKLSRL
jgi:hypothetical protein